MFCDVWLRKQLTGMFLNGRRQELLCAPVERALGQVASLAPLSVNPPDALDGTDGFLLLAGRGAEHRRQQDAASTFRDYHAGVMDTARQRRGARRAIDRPRRRSRTAVVWEIANADARPARHARPGRGGGEGVDQKATHLDDQMKGFGQWDAWVNAPGAR